MDSILAPNLLYKSYIMATARKYYKAISCIVTMAEIQPPMEHNYFTLYEVVLWEVNYKTIIP